MELDVIALAVYGARANAAALRLGVPISELNWAERTRLWKFAKSSGLSPEEAACLCAMELESSVGMQFNKSVVYDWMCAEKVRFECLNRSFMPKLAYL
jgi:hypothetical protein